MRRSLILLAALTLATPAAADLTTGTVAPQFTANGAMAGEPYAFNLKAALKKGPVVLYFFPSAFTGGCNAEAHAFAEAIPDFQKAGATVVGMTAGKVDQLAQFSKEKCAGKFAVAAANPDVIKSYDVALKRADGKATGITSRTSYVIAPNGKILLVHNDMNPADHIKLTLEAVQKYRKAHPRG